MNNLESTFWIFLICCSWSLMAQGTLDPDIVAYYPLDGHLEDRSENSNDGQIFGSPVSVEGVVGQAMYFDGTDDYAFLPHSADFAEIDDGLTITAWIKPENFFNNRWVTLLTKTGLAEGEWPYNVTYRIHDDGETVPFLRFRGVNTSAHSAHRLIDAPGSLEIGAWNFITWRFDQGVVSVFLNNEQLGSHTFNFTQLMPTEGPLELARDSPADTEFFHGAIDELCFFKRALTDIEVNDIFKSGKENLTAVYDRSDPSSITIYPNPADGWLSWYPAGELEYELYSTRGSRVRTGKGSQVETFNLPAGVYYLKLAGRKLEKVIIKRRIVIP